MKYTTGLHKPRCVEWRHRDGTDLCFGEAPSEKRKTLINILHIKIYNESNNVPNIIGLHGDIRGALTFNRNI